MFGEFFPNPSYADQVQIDWIGAMLAEAMGTFALVMAILWITRGGGKLSLSQSMLIGLAVSSIIMVLAPYTQAGINPARDLGPEVGCIHCWLARHGPGWVVVAPIHCRLCCWPLSWCRSSCEACTALEVRLI